MKPKIISVVFIISIIAVLGIGGYFIAFNPDILQSPPKWDVIQSPLTGKYYETLKTYNGFSIAEITKEEFERFKVKRAK